MADEVEQRHVSDITKQPDQPEMQITGPHLVPNLGDLAGWPTAQIARQQAHHAL
jgi:hypothetical protein